MPAGKRFKWYRISPLKFTTAVLFMIKIFILLILLTTNLTSHAKTSLWKVQYNGNTIYLGGTIHLLKQTDYPLPKEYEQAYHASETLVLETDISKLNEAQLQLTMINKINYSAGKTLSTSLKKATLTQLKHYLEQKQLSFSHFEQFKPSLVSLSLQSLEMVKLGMTQSGVDAYYHHKALQDKRKIHYLESPEQQIDFIANMGKGQEDEMILQTIKEMKELPELLTKLKQAWRQGEPERLHEYATKDWQADFPDTYQQILVKRNQNWLPNIEAMLKTPTKELILVGALHLSGEQGILKTLEKKGYKIKQL